jgi:hypothetical protein
MGEAQHTPTPWRWGRHCAALRSGEDFMAIIPDLAAVNCRGISNECAWRSPTDGEGR